MRCLCALAGEPSKGNTLPAKRRQGLLFVGPVLAYNALNERRQEWPKEGRFEQVPGAQAVAREREG